MPQPTSQQVHVSRPLTDISVAYIQDASAYVAGQAFPNIPVAKQADQYFVYSREDFYRIQAAKRAPGTESAGSGFDLTTDNYFADVYAFHKDVDDDTRANSDAAIDPDRDASQYVTQQLLLLREQEWFNAFFNTGIWGVDRAGNAAPAGTQFLFWNDAASDPVADVRFSATDIESRTGFRANTLVLGPAAWNAIADNDSVLDRIKHTQLGITTPQLVAAAMEIDRILVARAVRNTAGEGAAEATSHFAADQALLCYVNPTPSLQQPSAGYTFSWTGRVGAGQFGNTISSLRAPLIKSDRIEGEMAFDQKLVAAELGVFFDNAVN